MSNDTDNQSYYKVGVTVNNNVELIVGHPSTITLVLSPVQTKSLIALLQAAVNSLEK